MISELNILDRHAPQYSTEQSMDPMENQLCRVCEEKAAGFHFGAFTCEGCKSFFGRFCNNQTNIPDCKNNYLCVVDKRNRTSCKACRLRKCLAVGMSKSGCRYGRRSNWFKIHCLMQRSADSKPFSARVSVPQVRPTATSSTGPQPAAFVPLVSPTSNSRSPSPLNTSSESSGPSPTPESGTPSPFFPFRPYQTSTPLFTPSPFPLLDPLTFYRLSPLMALHPLLQKTSDFHEQLRILAERRAVFEAERRAVLEASCANRSSVCEDIKPIDLSVK